MTAAKHFQDYKDITIFRGPCIVIYSYNKSQQDALFLNFILVKNSTCFGKIMSVIGSLNTVFTAIGIFILVMLTVC
jgi:hypothetical protein